MGNTVSSPSGQQPLYDRQTFPRSEKKLVPKANTLGRSDNLSQSAGNNQESSRMLFLMYLINRTWNVVTEGKGGKRWVRFFRSRKMQLQCCRLGKAITRSSGRKAKPEKNEEAPKTSGTVFTFIPTWLLSTFIVLFYFSSSHSFASFCSHETKNSCSDDDISKPRFLDLEGKANDDNYSCAYGSECSECSCGYCEDENCRINGNYSICER